MAEPWSDASEIDEAWEADCGLIVAGCKDGGCFSAFEATLEQVAKHVDGHVGDLALDQPRFRSDRALMPGGLLFEGYG